ncbi:MAG: glycosyltransferase family 2 protein [Lachnospiraceae bacterium]|nr:glycosyltransferase family 2 protein [Lachnospiraceae bacterium]
MEDKVSIIIPVHNAGNYIEDTVRSVLDQTFTDWELILVENGSTDDSKEKLEKIGTLDTRIKVMSLTEASSAAKARNAGIKEAAGRYITFLDADDLWRENKLERELAFMKDKNAAFVFTGYEFGDSDAKPTGKTVRVPETLDHKGAMKNTTIFTSTVMFDTDLVDKELIDMPDIKSEDTALWWKILREGFIAYGLDENLVIYRRPVKSLSSNKFEAIKRIWYLYRKWENLSFIKSAWYFANWAVRAVGRRI